jgi:hypothetical protein
MGVVEGISGSAILSLNNSLNSLGRIYICLREVCCVYFATHTTHPVCSCLLLTLLALFLFVLDVKVNKDKSKK